MLDAARFAHFLQPLEQFILAVEAAVRVVLQVIGILKLVRRDHLVPDAELAREVDGVAFVGFRDGSGIGRDSYRLLSQRPVRGPGQIRRVRSTGVGHDHLAHVPQDREQLLLLLFHTVILLQR